jgi:dephospho-CoA kinase
VFKVGITGGIGSGKSSVCRVFEVLNIPVFSADRIASQIMSDDDSIINGINIIAGKNVYPGGSLDKKALSDIIFNDKEKLHQVDSLVHPAVIKHFFRWMQEQSSEYVIMEAAILFESGAAKFMDKVITVNAPLEERIERTMQRNNLSRNEVTERIRNQMDDAARAKKSDYIINNAENDMILPVVLQIHNEILNTINTQI